ncbi:MAG: NAD(P)/FAD-dependent oxidoreductase [Myxococcota bacterium]
MVPLKIVIVGNGVTGMEAALAVRAADRRASLTIVSEESDHFFSRTALMYVLSGQLSRRDIEPFPRDLPTKLGFEICRARAVGIDPATKSVLLEGSHGSLTYDRLLIACGSRPRPPPWPGAAVEGIGHFVRLPDLDWLERELRPDRRNAAQKSPWVVGGGLIGLEVVETMLSLGYRPKMAIRDEWLWPVALDPREARFVEERLRAHGVELFAHANVERFVGSPRVQGIVLDGVEHKADLVVVAIGVEPNTAWLHGGPVPLEGGAIVVDEGLMTALPDVFAAGDCAGILGPDGRHAPEQLWYTARDQGRIAGQRLLGQDARYRPGVPYNSAKLMDLEYTTVGWIPPAGQGESWFHHEQGKVESTLRIVHEAGRVRGLSAIGRRFDHAVIRGWIEAGLSVGAVLDRLREAAFDSEFVPPLVIPKEAR